MKGSKTGGSCGMASGDGGSCHARNLERDIILGAWCWQRFGKQPWPGTAVWRISYLQLLNHGGPYQQRLCKRYLGDIRGITRGWQRYQHQQV